ncbi:hypothetical protein [Comamonas odontotermitis]|uniref:hypothetical protein n=1 Tax=Comamonas odontotermitis TaxID=379895 RepID=UPI003750BD25
MPQPPHAPVHEQSERDAQPDKKPANPKDLNDPRNPKSPAVDEPTYQRSQVIKQPR